MNRSRFRFTLGELMGVVAAVALVFALLPVPLSVVFSIVLIVCAFVVAVLAAITSASRLGLALWIFALYPVLPVASLYATWFTAWAVLGHPPRPSLDDPKFISPVVDVPYSLTFLLLECFAPALAISVPLWVVVNVQSAWRFAYPLKAAPGKRLWQRNPLLHLLVPLVIWSLAFLLFWADPLGILNWLLD